MGLSVCMTHWESLYSREGISSEEGVIDIKPAVASWCSEEINLFVVFFWVITDLAKWCWSIIVKYQDHK